MMFVKDSRNRELFAFVANSNLLTLLPTQWQKETEPLDRL